MSIRQLTAPRYLSTFFCRPGMKTYLPGSTHFLQMFPTAFRLYSCRYDESELLKEVVFPDLGPISGWMVSVDTMRHAVFVEGRGAAGFFRYRIDATPDGIVFRSLKSTMKVRMNGLDCDLGCSEKLVLIDTACASCRFPTPRLLLGCNKESSLERIVASPTMDEVLPLWYQLALPDTVLIEPSETLLGNIINAVQRKQVRAVSSAFSAFFRTAIDGFFVPKRFDDLFLGSALPLLPEAMALSQVHPVICSLLRSLFLQESGAIVTVLPCLPSECVAGRLLNETLLTGHSIDIEWRKGQLRRVLIKAMHDGVVSVQTSSKTGSICALSKGARKKKFAMGDEIELKKGEQILLDNFST